jgi:hypothetical protein
MRENVEVFNEACAKLDAVPDDQLDNYLKQNFHMARASVRKSFISEYIPLRDQYREIDRKRKEIRESQEKTIKKI